jgi:aspartyl-tRNA(Asn)/glutamyl-tRNA(Gln) amidotransferase subunit C
MAEFDRETVRHVARLARIRVPEEQLAPLANELSHILGWIEQLGEVDTSGVEPMTSAVPHELTWRQDEVTDGGQADKVTANAPAASDHFFTVPKVVE